MLAYKIGRLTFDVVGQPMKKLGFAAENCEKKIATFRDASSVKFLRSEDRCNEIRLMKISTEYHCSNDR